MEFTTQLGKAILGIGIALIALGLCALLGIEDNSAGVGVCLLGINTALVGLLLKTVSNTEV